MVAINRGDNTRAFGGDFLRIYLNNPNNIYISKAVFHVNHDLEKVYENPVFPLRVNFTGEETMLLRQDNTCQLALWDESGRRRTADGKFTFFVRENRIKEPDNPDYYGDEYYGEDENSVVFDLTDAEFVAQFSIAVSPTKMSELQQDIPYMVQDNIVGGRNIHTFKDGNNVIIEATLDTVQSYNSLIDKPSINGQELVGDLNISCEQVQADYREDNPQSKAYIKNKPEFANVAFSGNYNHLSNTPTIPDKVSQLENDSKFINKNVDNLSNYYTKEQTEELIQGGFDPTPLYQAIDVVQTSVDDLESSTATRFANMQNEMTDADTSLRNQINAVRDNLGGRINNLDTELTNVEAVVNTKVDLSQYEQEMAEKANVEDMAEALLNKVDKESYLYEINKKADKSSIGKGTLTLRKNGEDQGTFNANNIGDVTIDIAVPTQMSELENDAEYITKSELETDGFATKQYVDNLAAGKVDEDDLGHGILDIQLNGESQGTFSANAKTNKTLDLQVPTKLSELEKDIEILTEEDLAGIEEQIIDTNAKVDINRNNINIMYSDLENKVDKVYGKSLISDTEITRLSNVRNYDDTGVKSTINTHTEQIQQLNISNNNKVDKIEGKGLSTNDFDNQYKNMVETHEETVNSLNNQVMNNLKPAVQTNTNDIVDLKFTTNELTTGLADEVSARETGINDLQEQINGMTAKSAVADIVQYYRDLQDYPTTKLVTDDVICVLCDETRDDMTTYYRWNGNDSQFEYVGCEGRYYTKEAADSKFVPKTLKLNGHPLNADLDLTARDVEALPEDTVIGDGTLTLQVEPTATKNITEVTELDEGVFTANQTGNNAVRIPIPTKTSHIENDSYYIDQYQLDEVVENTQGQIDNINEVTTYLGDHVEAIEAVLTGEVSPELPGLAKVTFTNDYNDLDNTPTIPSALSQLHNDIGVLTSQEDPSTTTLEDVLEKYQLIEDTPTKVSDLENDRGYVTNSAIGRGTLTVKVNGEDFANNTWMANEKDAKTIDIPVDTELDENSKLPVENRVITNALSQLDGDAVHVGDDAQTITGPKTFNNLNAVSLNITSVGTAPNPIESDDSQKIATTHFVVAQNFAKRTETVNKTGDQTVTGVKEFTEGLLAPTVVGSDDSNNVATTAFVQDKIAPLALDADVVKVTGNQPHIQGDKTFEGTIRFTSNVNLGSYASAATPSSSAADTQVANVIYVKNADTVLNNRITSEVATLNQTIIDQISGVDGDISGVVSVLRGEIGQVQTNLDTYITDEKTFNHLTDPDIVLQADTLNYMTITEDTSIVPPNITDDYYHDIKIQMYVPTLYNISLGTSVTIDEPGLYDITYIWFKPVQRWICNIVKY